MDTTDEQVRQWAKEVERSFRFLETRGYTRQAPALSVAWGSVTFLGRKLGVRLEVEIDGFFMFVALVRVGQPEYDATSYLQECLEILGLPTEEKELLSLRGDFSNCNRMLEILADSLAANLESIENSVDQLFPE
jgi:hypothetical protein